MDLSPIQPTDVPENCDFIVGDLTEDLDSFDDGSVDLVHSRCVNLGIRKDQWPGYINEIYRILKPGTGWFQCGENGAPAWDKGGVPENSVFAQYCKMLYQRLEDRNLCLDGKHVEQRLIDAGFVDIKVFKKIIDIGDWRGGSDPHLAHARRAAKWTVGNGITGLIENLTDEFPDDEDKEIFKQKVLHEYNYKNLPLYFTMYFVIGRKPDIV